MPQSHVDVLIVGAGPTGVMCANALAMAGIDVRIIDKRAVRLTVGRADGVQPRTTEVMQSYGLAERLIQEGKLNHVLSTTLIPTEESRWIQKCTGRVPNVLPVDSLRYPYLIALHQAAVEDIFLDSMRKHGVEVERPSKPADIQISEDIDELSSISSYPVQVTVEHLDAIDQEDRIEIVHAKFVVGADGAHSWVRKALGIEMEGEKTDQAWGVVDWVPDTNFPDIHKFCIIHSENGSCLIIPREKGLIRVDVQVSDADVVSPLTGGVDKTKMTPQQLISSFRKIIHPYELADPKEINWWTVYLHEHQLACSYSVKDRVFIAGDACHTQSPKAAQGLNAGLNDTHNLAWKLAYVLRGWSPLSLLETYEHERRKCAQDIVNFDAMWANVLAEEASKEFGKLTSGVGIHYPPSAIVDPKHQQCTKNLIIGQRMPPQIFVRAADIHPVEIQDLLPADTRFKVLYFVGSLSQTRVAELTLLAEQLSSPSSFLHKYSPNGDISTVFDIITITAGKKEDLNYLLVPPLFRPHWTKVLLDDTDVTESKGGRGYEKFGIDPEQITVVVVRPDGYVGTIVPSTAIAPDLEAYFVQVPQLFLLKRAWQTECGQMALSKAERSYIQSSLLSDPPLRLDGRSLTDYRPIALETGVVPLANGSAKVCIGLPGRGGYVEEAGGVGGGTEVVVGVKLEVASIGEEEEGGSVQCTVSCAAAAYPSLSSNALDDLQSDLTILLGSVLSHPSLRPNNLVIVPGKKAWTVKLDAVVFADGGNLVDCLMFACRAALWDTKVPRTRVVEYRVPHRHATRGDTGMDVDADGGTEGRGGLVTKDTNDATDFELTDYWDEGEVLGGRESWPVCVTLNVLSDVHFLDATLQEEASVPLRMHLMYAFPSGKPILQTLRLVGLEVSTVDQIKDLVKRSETYGHNAWIGLEAKLKDEEARRGVKAREKFYGTT